MTYKGNMFLWAVIYELYEVNLFMRIVFFFVNGHFNENPQVLVIKFSVIKPFLHLVYDKPVTKL